MPWAGNRMKKLLPVLVIGLALFGAIEINPELLRTLTGTTVANDEVLASAYRDRRSDVQAGGTGIVSRVLADDNKGSRHQRFILELDSGQKLLVAHNIDLAPRLPGLARGDRVEFYGEYEWNDRGGVIHWTHHDPAGRHVGGWLKYKGGTYQ